MDLIAFEEDKIAALEILANKQLTKLVLQDGQWAVKVPQKLLTGLSSTRPRWDDSSGH